MVGLPNWIDARWLRLFRQRLTRWYALNQRSLPWRTTDNAYAIWVSEIMLQQTQVATVLAFYLRFLRRFGSVQELAAADESEVLKYWEGLGYYRRARQMHTAARTIVADHQSEFPKDFKSVLALPGIGRYTAGAICSFAYDQPTPIVEANTQRLYARLLRIEEPLTDTETQAALWAFAEKILTKQNSRSINQAVMELGSLVCQPKPRCQACPLVELCPTFAEGLQETIPAPKRKTVYEERHEVALIAANSQGQYLIRKCGPDEWWAGLWDFPRFVISIASDVKTQEVDIRTKARQIFNLDLCDMPPLFSIKHSVTRFRITLACYRATVQSQPKNGEMRAERLLSGQPSRWVTLADLDSIPLSASGRRVVNRLAAKAGSKRATETL